MRSKTTPEIRRRLFHLWCEGNRQLEAGISRAATMAELGEPYGLAPQTVSQIIRSFSPQEANRRRAGTRRSACTCNPPGTCRDCRRRATQRACARRRFYQKKGEPMPPVRYEGTVHLVDSWNSPQPKRTKL